MPPPPPPPSWIISKQKMDKLSLGKNSDLSLILNRRTKNKLDMLVDALIDAWMEDPAAKDNDTYHITLPPTDNSSHRTTTTPSSYHSYDDITEDAINDKREFIKSACISYGVYDIGMLLSMSNTLWTGMGIKGRLAIAKRAALRYMQHKASSMDRAELWSAMATRQRPIDKMRSINIPVEMDCRLSI
ncbi:hypothetical protein FOZ62_002442 [Perkinsus olseni]|uniref:Uncharacterized protein n=1 Tax=Perkinsus olseni TaxID=32597 RepID=A0A7J6RCC8_PEROL|nr:hypothetical protein FOZ62_002442 [Perkinsus olseni]